MYPIDPMPPDDDDPGDKLPWRIGFAFFLIWCLIDALLGDDLPFWPDSALIVGGFLAIVLGGIVHGIRSGRK